METALGVLRLQHRSAQVQLLTLSLSDALVNNCAGPLHLEINSKLFLNVLQSTIAHRNTHAVVAKKIYALVNEWAKAHQDDEIWDPSVSRSSLPHYAHQLSRRSLLELAATFKRQCPFRVSHRKCNSVLTPCSRQSPSSTK